jgi:hypothetical protein
MYQLVLGWDRLEEGETPSQAGRCGISYEPTYSTDAEKMQSHRFYSPKYRGSQESKDAVRQGVPPLKSG